MAPLDLRDIFSRTDETGDVQDMTPTTQHVPDELADLLKKLKDPE
jgi:hypothetical protein